MNLILTLVCDQCQITSFPLGCSYFPLQFERTRSYPLTNAMITHRGGKNVMLFNEILVNGCCASY